MSDVGEGGIDPAVAFHEAVAGHAAAPDHATWERLRQASADLGASRGGGYSVDIARDIDGRVGPILEGDAVTWGRILHDLEARRGGHLRERVLAASPFRGMALVFRTSPGPNEVTYKGDVAVFLDGEAEGRAAAVDIGGGVEMYVFGVSGPASAPPADDDGSVGC